jgi:hypothetical protein
MVFKRKGPRGYAPVGVGPELAPRLPSLSTDSVVSNQRYTGCAANVAARTATTLWPVGGLLDHLVGADQQRVRHGQAEGLRGPQVDRQVELCGLLHRQVGGPAIAENAGPCGRRPSEMHQERWRHSSSVHHPPYPSGTGKSRESYGGCPVSAEQECRLVARRGPQKASSIFSWVATK